MIASSAGGNFEVDHRRRGHVALEHAPRHLFACAAKETTTEAQLVQHHAQREDVGALIDRMTEQLLGRHVRELARDLSLLRDRRRARRRDAEVEDLAHPVVADVDVGRVDVAVDEAQRRAVLGLARVHVVEALARLHDDADRQIERQAPAVGTAAAHHVDELFALEQLHRDEVLTAELAEVVGVDDVVVRQRRRDAGFVEEHADDLGPRREFLAQRLDDELLREAFDPGVLRTIDLGHAARRDVLDE